MAFPIVAGAILGVSAGLLTTSAGYIAVTYAEEKDKGLYRAIQWSSVAFGATVGGCIALGINFHATTASVPKSIYITFIVIQICAIGIAALIMDVNDVVRCDGTSVAIHTHSGLKNEIKGVLKLFLDWRMLVLIPACFCGELLLSLQSSINGYAFNLRTRTLNSLLTNLLPIPFIYLFGKGILDNERLGSRKRRGLIAIALAAVWCTGSYIALIVWLHSWDFNRAIKGPDIDWTDAAYPGAVVVYLCYGIQYGFLPNLVLWVLGSLSNQPDKLSQYAAYFIAWLSVGTTIAFALDSVKTPYLNQGAAYFGIVVGLALPGLAFICYKCTTDSKYYVEENVFVPKHVQLEKAELLEQE